MLRYIVNSKKNIDRLDGDNLLLELLKLRGVEKPQELLNLSPQVLCDATGFRSISRAIELFNSHLNANSNIHIIIDSDVDGLTSASTMWGYISDSTEHYPTYDTHDRKQHGLYKDIVERIPVDTDLLIVPDAGSDKQSQEFIEGLVNRGIDVLVLDHHEIENTWEDGYYTTGDHEAIIINNQDGFYGNTTLSGVGVVFKFLDLYDEVYPNHADSRNYLGLVSLGMIADLMDVRNSETRFLINSGLKYMLEDSELIEAIAEHNSYGMQGKVTIETVGWNIAPMMNACFRQGDREDKLLMFEAMNGIRTYREFDYEPKRATKDNPNKETIHETLIPHMIRVMDTLKRQQDKQKKDSSKELISIIDNSDLKDHKIIILDTTGIINSTHTGITANELAKRYQRPVILLTEYNEEEYGGSARNYDKFELDDLNQFVTDSGVMEGIGHANSFGVRIRKDDIDTFKEYCNEQLKDVDTTPIYHVDFEIPISRLKERHIRQVGQWQDEFGGKCMDMPKFAITGIQIDSADIKMNKTFMKFEIEQNGQTLVFVKKFVSQDEYNKITHNTHSSRCGRGDTIGNKKLDVTLIGKFIINKWNDKEFPQIEITEIDTEISEGTKRRRL